MYPLVLPSLLTCPPPVSCLISSPCLGFDLGEFQFNTVTMHIDTQMFEVLYIGNNQQNQDLMQSFFFFFFEKNYNFQQIFKWFFTSPLQR